MRNAPRILFLLVLLCGLLAACNPAKTDTQAGSPADSVAPAPAVGLVTMAVHLPDTLPRVWEVETDAPMTVRELMDALRSAQFAFTDTLYPGMGHLVTSVAGLQNAKGEGAYWQFCLDNVASDRGVDESKIAPGQRVDWHYALHGKLPCKKVGE